MSSIAIYPNSALHRCPQAQTTEAILSEVEGWLHYPTHMVILSEVEGWLR